MTLTLILYCQYDVEHDPEEEQAFNGWLRCYYQDGMQNLVDRNGRTIWFAGPPGPMKPSNSKSRGKRTSKKEKEEEACNDHDYTPKRTKKKTAQNGTTLKKAKKTSENGTVQKEPKNGTQKRPKKSPKTEKVASSNKRSTRSSSKDQ